MHNLKILIKPRRIQNRVKELARQISRDLQGKDVVVVGVLKGAFLFMADLIRNMTIMPTCDFLRVSSYGDSTYSSGTIRIEFDLTQPIKDKTVLLVEDIVDTGLTLKHVVQSLLTKEPKELLVCVLLCKSPKVDVKIDYMGFKIPQKFVAGYGLDYQGRYRNLPYIAVVSI